MDADDGRPQTGDRPPRPRRPPSAVRPGGYGRSRSPAATTSTRGETSSAVSRLAACTATRRPHRSAQRRKPARRPPAERGLLQAEHVWALGEQHLGQQARVISESAHVPGGDPHRSTLAHDRQPGPAADPGRSARHAVQTDDGPAGRLARDTAGRAKASRGPTPGGGSQLGWDPRDIGTVRHFVTSVRVIPGEGSPESTVRRMTQTTDIGHLPQHGTSPDWSQLASHSGRRPRSPGLSTRSDQVDERSGSLMIDSDTPHGPPQGRARPGRLQPATGSARRDDGAAAVEFALVRSALPALGLRHHPVLGLLLGAPDRRRGRPRGGPPGRGRDAATAPELVTFGEGQGQQERLRRVGHRGSSTPTRRSSAATRRCGSSSPTTTSTSRSCPSSRPTGHLPDGRHPGGERDSEQRRLPQPAVQSVRW